MPTVKVHVVKLDYYGTPNVKETLIGAIVLDGIPQTKTMQFYLDKLHEMYEEYDENVKGRKLMWIIEGENDIFTFNPRHTYIKDLVQRSARMEVQDGEIDFLIKVFALDTTNSKLNESMKRKRMDRGMISGRMTQNRRKKNIKF